MAIDNFPLRHASLRHPAGNIPLPEGEPCNKEPLCFFRPAGCLRDGLARQISAPLGSADGELTGNPSVASLALTLAP